jgi:hypothetical protein
MVVLLTLWRRNNAQTVEAIVPKRIEWTEVQDTKIKRMRAERAAWDTIAIAVGVTRWTVIERGRRLGARLPPPEFEPPPDDPERPPLPSGHEATWGAIVRGTSLEGMQYPIPIPIR